MVITEVTVQKGGLKHTGQGLIKWIFTSGTKSRKRDEDRKICRKKVKKTLGNPQASGPRPASTSLFMIHNRPKKHRNHSSVFLTPFGYGVMVNIGDSHLSSYELLSAHQLGVRFPVSEDELSFLPFYLSYLVGGQWM